MRKSVSVLYWNSAYALRARCKDWSAFAGYTVYVKFVAPERCELWVRYKDGSAARLLAPREACLVRAVVEWEIAKAEGALRKAA